MQQAGYLTLKDMTDQLDSRQLQELRRVYGFTQKRKGSRIDEVVECWGADAAGRLRLDNGPTGLSPTPGTPPCLWVHC